MSKKKKNYTHVASLITNVIVVKKLLYTIIEIGAQELFKFTRNAG